MTNEIEQLAKEVASLYPSAKLDFDPFPSGAVMLDVLLNGRPFVLEFVPGRGFGVDEAADGEGFNTGYRHRFATLKEARHQLLQMLSAAAAEHAEAA